MKIEPVQPTLISVSHQGNDSFANLININQKELFIRSTQAFKTGDHIKLTSHYFYGCGVIQAACRQPYQYQYHLSIEDIHYRRGIVIDETL